MAGLSCGTWDVASWPGIEPRPPALGAWSLSDWTTREVLTALILIHQEWKHKMVQPLCKLFDIVLKSYIYILCSNQSASYWLIQKCFCSFIKSVFDRKVGIQVVPRERCCSHPLDGDSPGLSQKGFRDSASSVCGKWVLCIYSQTAEVWLPSALVWYRWVFGKFPSPITWNCWEDLIDWVVSAQ